MPIWICATCGIEHPATANPPTSCVICSDDRQWVPPSGQRWTTQEELATDRRGEFAELEDDLQAVRVRPSFAIGQRGLLLRTPGGNLLWEPPGFLDESMIETVRELGGLAAIGASHPHLVGSSVSWSGAFGGVPIYAAAVDRRWIRRPDPAIELYSAATEILPGVRLVPCGGHFPGSAVAHWAAGAGGRGVLLVGDTMMVTPGLTSVSFMRSYPNLLPLPARLVRQIVATVGALSYDRIYGGFDGQVIRTGAAEIVQWSAERYIGWLADDIRDPDEQAGSTLILD